MKYTDPTGHCAAPSSDPNHECYNPVPDFSGDGFVFCGGIGAVSVCNGTPGNNGLGSLVNSSGLGSSSIDLDGIVAAAEAVGGHLGLEGAELGLFVIGGLLDNDGAAATSSASLKVDDDLDFSLGGGGIQVANSSTKDEMYEVLGMPSISRSQANRAQEVADGLNEGVDATDEFVTDPVNYVPGGTLIKGGKTIIKGLNKVNDTKGIPNVFSFGRLSSNGFRAPKTFTDSQGLLSNGLYRYNGGNAIHATGVLSSGKSQFFNRLNDKQLVLDAAAYANKAGLWVGNKAKIILDRPIGVHAGTGNPTNVLNVYRTNNGIVHGAPGSPL